MRFEPRDYQKEAIDSIIKSLATNNRATAVMACGTGKTLVALWVAERLQAKTILILMPSLLLIKQTIEAWSEQTSWSNYKYMAICCDDKLLDDDEIKIGADECCFDICINTDQVYKFMNTDHAGVRLIFSTYQSSYIIPKNIAFDLAIFDEAHKTAHKDGGIFRYCLSDENATINKRLFLTATPRHYQLKGSKTQLEYSMDNKEIYGPIIYRLDFAQAIKKGIICDYRVLITIINDELICESFYNKTIELKNKKIDMAMAAHAVALKQVFDKYPIKRVVTFQRTIKDTKEFTHTAEITGMPGIKLLNINSQMTSEYRASIMDSFEHSNRAIISNARCLSEGIDIPSIDLVAFLSPKKSKVDIIQAIGRVMRNAPGKEYGYILLPLYRKQKIQSLDDIADSSEYAHILQIINSLREYDTDLQQQINNRYRDHTTYSERDNKIQFVDTGLSYNELKKAIDIDIIEKSIDNWDVRYEEAKKWYTKNDSWIVKNKKNLDLNAKSIVSWIKWQRLYYKKNELSHDKIQKLKDIDFIFDANEFRRYVSYIKLMDSIKHNKSLPYKKQDRASTTRLYSIVSKYNNGEELYNFEKNLIILLEKDEKGKALLSGGIIKTRQQNYLNEIKKFYKEHQHLKIKYRENRKLWEWLQTQLNGKMPILPDLQKFLNEINYKNIYCKNRSERLWNDMYNRLILYKKENTELIFPQKIDAKWKSLSRWVYVQRRKNRMGNKLLPYQKEKLESLGLFNYK